MTSRLLFLVCHVAALSLALAAAKGGDAIPQPPPARIPTYTVRGTGVLPGYEGSRARGINNAGQVVGFSYRSIVRDILILEERAFLFDDDGIVDLGTSTAWSGAEAINNQGQVVGWDIGTQLDEEAFVWEGGELTHLGVFLGSVAASHALDINDGGDVVGWCSCGLAGHTPFLWTQANGMVDLGSLGDYYINAISINNNRQVAGTFFLGLNAHAFLWDNGEMIELPLKGSASSAAAFDINDIGQIVGSSGGAVIWQNGGVEYLALPPSPTTGNVRHINNHSQAVGSALWHRRQKYELPPLLPPDSRWQVNSVNGLNDAGQIVGRCMSTVAVLPSQGCILTPIDCDVNNDLNVDGPDFSGLQSCLGGPASAVAPGCEVADFDHDGDVDIVDYRALELAFEPAAGP